MTVTLDGQIMWPPPQVSVSAAPAQKAEEEALPEKPSKTGTKAIRGLWWKIVLGIIAAVLIVMSPASAASHYIVFMLACVVGFYVITNVTHTLHTPLMSETNAISGIIIVGAILQIGSDNPVIAALSFVAMSIAAINIFGGFRVTQRMLKMFRKA